MKKTGHGNKLSRKREAAIVALITHGTVTQAATACGVSQSTLRRWMQEPDFQADYSQSKRELLDGTINRLRKAGVDAVVVLHQVAVDRASPAGARVGAGRAILEIMLRAVETQDLADRLDKLEEAMKGDGG